MGDNLLEILEIIISKLDKDKLYIDDKIKMYELSNGKLFSDDEETIEMIKINKALKKLENGKK